MSEAEWTSSLIEARPKRPGESWRVFLGGAGEGVSVGPFANPARAKELAEQFRQYLAAVVRESRNRSASS